jgi:hypothetical protein
MPPPSKIEKEVETIGLRLLAASPILARQQLVHRQTASYPTQALGKNGWPRQFLPGTSPELATITDFNILLGATEILGSWSVKDLDMEDYFNVINAHSLGIP